MADDPAVRPQDNLSGRHENEMANEHEASEQSAQLGTEDETSKEVESAKAVADEDVECEEDSNEAAQTKRMFAPSAPSRQEALEHACTHVPYRSWCPHCVAGKAKSKKHQSSGQMAESEVPVVAMDYAFMSDKTEQESGVENGDDAESENEIKILVARDARSRVCLTLPVPQKGVDPQEWSVRQCLKFLDFLGYKKLMLHTDQEAALKAILAKLQLYRGEDVQLMAEHTPVGESKSNGFIARTNQTAEG